MTGIGEIVRLGGAEVLLEGHLDIDDIRGIRPLRLPRSTWAHFPPNGEILRAITANGSGVRLRFTTAATHLSLTLRLFGNIYGEHQASEVFYGFLGGFGVPIPMMFLGLFAAFLQAFVFCLLSMIYIRLATEH